MAENWLGCQGSNLGMRGSKPRALPLGYTPINCFRKSVIPSLVVRALFSQSSTDIPVTLTAYQLARSGNSLNPTQPLGAQKLSSGCEQRRTINPRRYLCGPSLWRLTRNLLSIRYGVQQRKNAGTRSAHPRC